MAAVTTSSAFLAIETAHEKITAELGVGHAELRK
jgi:hypothetical protein